MWLRFVRPISRSARDRHRGQALTEFALIVPLMILILLVAVDFGRLFFAYVQITNAAREGAAYGISNPSDGAGINTRARQETNVQTESHRSAGTLTITTTCSPESCAAAQTSATRNVVTVTISQPFSFLTPVIGNVVGTITLTSSASSVALGKAGVPATAPPCITVPTVNGLAAPGAADAAITAAGLVPSGTVVNTGTADGKARSQSPVAGTCVAPTSPVVSYVYRP